MNSTTMLNENYSSSLNATLSNNLTFTDIILNPLFYGSAGIFIFLILCLISFIIILKSKKKFLLSNNL